MLNSQLVADRSIDGGLDFLIEVKICLSAVLQRKSRIVGLVALGIPAESCIDPCVCRRTPPGPEHFLKRAEREIHVGEDIEGLLILLLVAVGVTFLKISEHVLRITMLLYSSAVIM